MKQTWLVFFLTSLLVLSSAHLGLSQAPGVVVFDDDDLLERITANGKHLLDAKKLVRLSTLIKQLDRTTCELTLAPVKVHKLEAPEVFEVSRQGTITVGLLALDKESGEWFFNAATGFILTSDGAISTSYHVLDFDEPPATPPKESKDAEKAEPKPEKEKQPDEQESYLVAADYEGHVYPVREVLAADKISDTCILRIEAEGLTPLPLNPNSRPGETVYCFSNPSDMFGHFSKGIIARFFINREPHEPPQKPNRPVTFLSVSAEFAVGSSGGPILDDRGNIVGQVQSTSSIFADAEEEHPQHPQMVVKAALAAREILALIKQPKADILVQASSSATKKIPLQPRNTPIETVPAERDSSDLSVPETTPSPVTTPAEEHPHETTPDENRVEFFQGEIRHLGAPLSDTPAQLTRIRVHFNQIQADYQTQSDALLTQIESATTAEQLAELNARAAQLVARTEMRCFRLANSSPSDPAVLPVLEYLILHSDIHQARAFELLTKYHIKSTQIGKTCIYLKGQNRFRRTDSDEAPSKLEKLARLIIKVNPHHEAIGLATLVLAEIIAEECQKETTTPEILHEHRHEAQALFMRVIRHFYNVSVPRTSKPDGSTSLTVAGSEAESGLRQLHEATRRNITEQLKGKFFFDRNAPRKNGSFTFGVR